MGKQSQKLRRQRNKIQKLERKKENSNSDRNNLKRQIKINKIENRIQKIIYKKQQKIDEVIYKKPYLGDTRKRTQCKICPNSNVLDFEQHCNTKMHRENFYRLQHCNTKIHRENFYRLQNNYIQPRLINVVPEHSSYNIILNTSYDLHAELKKIEDGERKKLEKMDNEIKTLMGIINERKKYILGNQSTVMYLKHNLNIYLENPTNYDNLTNDYNNFFINRIKFEHKKIFCWKRCWMINDKKLNRVKKISREKVHIFYIKYINCLKQYIQEMDNLIIHIKNPTIII
jgi:hypothetical protein